jgi:predicted NUDIX family NTP pyrophosphohydrolase
VKQSAGTLLYRTGPAGLEVLLVHPSGAYNRKAKWSLPKGAVEEGEEPRAAAVRETREETGVYVADGQAAALADLGHVDYTRSRKRVLAFAGPAPADAAPRCASWEVDCAEFVPLARARELIHPDQAVFLDRLEELLNRGRTS